MSYISHVNQKVCVFVCVLAFPPTDVSAGVSAAAVFHNRTLQKSCCTEIIAPGVRKPDSTLGIFGTQTELQLPPICCKLRRKRLCA